MKTCNKNIILLNLFHFFYKPVSLDHLIFFPKFLLSRYFFLSSFPSTVDHRLHMFPISCVAFGLSTNFRSINRVYVSFARVYDSSTDEISTKKSFSCFVYFISLFPTVSTLYHSFTPDIFRFTNM